MNIDAAEFKAKCLKLIDDVVATRRPLLITKRGKPVARIVPVEDESAPPAHAERGGLTAPVGSRAARRGGANLLAV